MTAPAQRLIAEHRTASQWLKLLLADRNAQSDEATHVVASLLAMLDVTGEVLFGAAARAAMPVMALRARWDDARVAARRAMCPTSDRGHRRARFARLDAAFAAYAAAVERSASALADVIDARDAAPSRRWNEPSRAGAARRAPRAHR